MASAVLASRNEPSFMGKTPYTNPHLNPNSKSLSSKRQIPATIKQSDGRYVDGFPSDNQSVPDDASSFNRRSYNSTTKQNQFNQGDYVSFDIASYRRKDMIKLKKRLIDELEQIRILANRIESGEFQLKSSSYQHPSTKKEEKKLLNKKGSGTKRPLPLVSGGRDSKRLASSENNGNLMKMCGQLLTKLMKHKRGYIFNCPVDVVGMGLHDYNHIIKHPMDLGTVKSNLGKNLYENPLDFASDVRLTFKNAMMYNPKGHEVHELAEQLLLRFEDSFRSVQQKCKSELQEQSQQQQRRGIVVEDLQESSWSQIPTQEKVKKSNVMEIVKKSERMQVPAAALNLASSNTPVVQSPVPTQSPIPVLLAQPLMRTKQPKPKAKDPNKREMSLEEKHKLGVGLQSLPDEKMTQVVQIIKKRNEHLTEDGDEIELDIEAVDTETLWELDRFVTNWKKMVSKIKRQTLMGNGAATTDGDMMVLKAESDGVVAPTKKAKKGEGGEEDVDIGDDIPMSSFPPVEIEKDDGRGHTTSSSSSSSGSSSGSSSSSDSDSGSSSGSDSDADNAQSRDFSRT